MERNKQPSYGLVFAAMLPGLRDVARRHGYALGVHGSMATDLDLIACPWTEDAGDHLPMVEEIRDHVRGYFPLSMNGKSAEIKPHGRLSYCIHFEPAEGVYATGPYIDVSVMPLQEVV